MARSWPPTAQVGAAGNTFAAKAVSKLTTTAGLIEPQSIRRPSDRDELLPLTERVVSATADRLHDAAYVLRQQLEDRS